MGQIAENIPTVPLVLHGASNIPQKYVNQINKFGGDMKNTGGRNAGTSTAGWFLSNFTKSKNWLHLDIAGTAYLEKSNKETLYGPTGVMIRSLMNYILS